MSSAVLRPVQLLAMISPLVMVIASSTGIQADPGTWEPFLRKHCHDCHAGDAIEGGLDLKRLATDLDDPAAFAKWERIHDRIVAGEMPPESVAQPGDSEKAVFLKILSGDLTRAHAERKGTVLRRLNRREYENTLNDLFGTNLKLAVRLPEDSRFHEFDNVGDALGISMVQLQRYMESIQAVLNESIVRTLAPPEVKVVRASYADTRGAEQWLNKIWLHREDGAVVFFKQYGYPSGMLREANVRKDGWYTVRVTGYAYQSEKPITFSVGGTTFARGAEMPTWGFFSFPPGAPTTIEFKTWIPENYMVDITPYGISDPEFKIRQTGALEYKGPGLAIQHVEIEGPLTEEFPSRGHRLVFDGLNRSEILPRNPQERERPWYTPKFQVQTDSPVRDVGPVLTRIAGAAYRRPVTAADTAPYVALFKSELDDGSSVEDALRSAVTAIFCSPDFLYLREAPGKLNDHALAARLSYFLTRTTPDSELLQVAGSGRLATDRTVLLRQTERLFEHPHFERFVADFTDAWLNLRDIEFTNPDETLFPEFDPFLKWSMVAETRSFWRKLIDENLGISNIVKSDFAMLNNRLAEHYGIDGVEGPEIRAVPLPPGSIRGGFLSQGSVLKVSANGTNTSPVVRGVYVMERILGRMAPPPPAGVPGVEPDIRGATTLRELLDRHRSVDACRGCHQMIDPPGFALESFDPIGGWRDRFRSIGQGDRVDMFVHGRRVQYRLGPPVDSSGVLSDGREFRGFAELRDLLAADQATLARALVTKLLTFATGREMGFSDREEIERIVKQGAVTDYGVRDLIKLAVTSDIFTRK